MRTTALRAGDSFYAPAGVAHTFINHGDAPARALVIDHPRGMEAFIHGAGEVVGRVDADAVRDATLGEREVGALLAAAVEVVQLSHAARA